METQAMIIKNIVDFVYIFIKYIEEVLSKLLKK